MIHTDERPFQCHICDKSFRRKSHLTVHVARHSGEGKFVCGICRKAYPVRDELNKHLLSHRKMFEEGGEEEIEVKYQCGLCDLKEFDSQEDLNDHWDEEHEAETDEAVEQITGL